jgi:hypothetical protein
MVIPRGVERGGDISLLTSLKNGGNGGVVAPTREQEVGVPDGSELFQSVAIMPCAIFEVLEFRSSGWRFLAVENPARPLVVVPLASELRHEVVKLSILQRVDVLQRQVQLSFSLLFNFLDDIKLQRFWRITARARATSIRTSGRRRLRASFHF